MNPRLRILAALLLPLALAGCFHRVDAVFTVWNYTDAEQSGAFGVQDAAGKEVLVIPFNVGPAAPNLAYTTPADAQIHLKPGTYVLWALVHGNGTQIEESHDLGSSVKGIQLQLEPERVAFQFVVT